MNLGIEVLDVDVALESRGTRVERVYGESAAAALWRALGLELDNNVVPGPRSGIFRRLVAGIASLKARRDGNSFWNIQTEALPEAYAHRAPLGAENIRPHGAFRITWWSAGGRWGERAWHLEALVLVLMDDDWATSLEVPECTFTVAGSGGTSAFTGAAVGALVADPIQALLARESARKAAGLEGGGTDVVLPLEAFMGAPSAAH